MYRAFETLLFECLFDFTHCSSKDVTGNVVQDTHLVGLWNKFLRQFVEFTAEIPAFSE